jgi:hypothetical protein
MKYNFVLLIVISLLFACSHVENNDKKTIILKDEIKEKIAQQLVGRWIFNDYLQQIEKTKKIFGNDNYGTQFYSYNAKTFLIAAKSLTCASKPFIVCSDLSSTHCSMTMSGITFIAFNS